MKAIFLDFDGVLNTYDSLSRGVHIDNNMVCRIDKLVRHASDCEARGGGVTLVISSTWRKLNLLKDLIFLLRSTGFRVNCQFDVTESIYDGEREHRGNEINHWLLEHPEVDGYVIIDDDADFFDHQKPFWIHTSMTTGFTDEHLEQAKSIFDTLDLC